MYVVFERRDYAKPWQGRMEPFKIVGNVYFVGCFPASTHVIDTGEGLILIDPGYAASLHLVVDGIYKLGFRPEQIKYIINTHWHWDHVAATAALAHMTGAKTLLGREDVKSAEKYFVPDILVKDGDTLTLGDTTVSFLETPGHTKGTISFFFETREDGKIYRVGMFGGAGVNTLKQGEEEFSGAREAYRASIHRLLKERVDVFIGNHVWNNNTLEHYEIRKQTGENKFIDDQMWGKFLTFCEKRLDDTIAQDTTET